MFVEPALRTPLLPGIGIFGVTEVVGREALRLAAMKLPIKTRTVNREDW